MPATFDLSKLNGQNGFTINGVTTGEDTGFSVSLAGDINADGIADIIVGETGGFSTPSYGNSYVVFGKSGPRQANLDLSTLNGSNGFTISGTVLGNYLLGYSVHSAGDLNADGVSDIVIGAPGNSASYVIFGKVGIGGTGTFNLSALNGNNGFTLSGTAADWTGVSVSGLGDVNGDGIDDLIIGASHANDDAGEAYVVFGKQGNWSSVLNLATLDGANGFTLLRPGIDTAIELGNCVSAAGDVNNDGISDILISVNYPFVYVIFGKRDLGSSGIFNLSRVDGSNGFVIPTPVSSARGAGDVNDDGIADFIIGNPNGAITVGSNGEVYVIFGNSGIGGNGIFDPSTLNGNNGFKINGVSVSDRSGSSCHSAGDVNRDGVNDLIVGASYATPILGNRTNGGISYVIFGQPSIGNNGAVELSSLNRTTGFKINGISAGDLSGFSANGVGDLNNDGIADILISSPGAIVNGMPNVGSNYLIFGQPGLRTDDTLELSNLNSATGVVFSGTELDTGFSRAGNSAGDFNGDGIPDFIIGAYRATANGRLNSGISYVVFGNPKINITNSIALLNLNGISGFILNGVSVGDACGISVNNAGDVNGDGVTDIILGAFQANPDSDRPQAGVSYVVFGVANPPMIVRNSLSISNGASQLFTSSCLNVTYLNHDSSLLRITISDLQHGQFELLSNPGTLISTFTQQQAWTNQVKFTHTGLNMAPSYSISADDGVVIVGPLMAEIDFTPSPDLSKKDLTPIIVGAAIGGGAGVLALIGLSSIYIKNKAKQTLEQAIEDSGNRDGPFRRNTFSPIVKEVYRQIKISGCLGQLDKKTADRFITAIQTLIEELGKQGVDLDLEKMTSENQQGLFCEIVRHIRFYTNSNSILGCSRFFKAEVTPTQIEDRAHAIAQGVANVIDSHRNEPKSPKGNTLTYAGIDELKQPLMGDVFGDEKANEAEMGSIRMKSL